VPDIEHTFDPATSVCTTLTNNFPALSVIDHKLAGVGRCKVTNFGITPNGLLPFGYMMDDPQGNYHIDWRSPLGQYLDSDQNPVNISSSGESIANTRCQQTAIALKAVGLRATAAKFYRYRSKTVSEYNADTDEFVDVTFDGNNTMCLLEKKCNSDSGAALLAGNALNESQCASSSPSKPLQFCGFRQDSSSLLQVTASSLCYIDQAATDPAACDKFGGIWDAVEYSQNPFSHYSCSAANMFNANGSASCWQGCTSTDIVDPLSGVRFSFYGECEMYHMCIVNANKSQCKGSNGAVIWVKFNAEYYTIDDTDDDSGICAFGWSNKWSSDWSSYNISVVSAQACSSATVVLTGTTFRGIFKPARAFRSGFLDSFQACSSGLCPSQLWVNIIMNFISTMSFLPFVSAN